MPTPIILNVKAPPATTGMNEIIVPFTYTDLPAPVAAELRAVTARIKDRLTRQVKDIIETGRDLLEVKSKLEHGQFESWLDSEFGMTVRTAQRFMRASEWAQDKNDIVSHLTPTTVYMLSAKSTPEGVHEQVVERLERGLPADPEYIQHVVQEAKIREREAKNRKENRETRAERKQRKAREEQWRRKEKEERRKKEEERQRIETAEKAVAREVADILVKKLSKDEVDKVYEALGDWNKLWMLRTAIVDARQSHSDNVAVFPPKPWAKS